MWIIRDEKVHLLVKFNYECCFGEIIHNIGLVLNVFETFPDKISTIKLTFMQIAQKCIFDRPTDNKPKLV